MVYAKTVTESSGGSADSPSRNALKITGGLIYDFELYLPPGSSGLLHVWIMHGNYQVWPSVAGETFFGDNTLIAFEDRYLVTAPPYQLDIYSYNLDDTYDHKFQVRIGQVSAELFIASYLPSMAFADLGEAMKSIVAAQELERANRQNLIEDYVGEPIPIEEEGS